MLHTTRGTFWGALLLLGVMSIMSMVGLRASAQEDFIEDVFLEEGVLEDGDEPDAFMDENLEDIVPPNTVSCFDYYAFGSVQANLTAPVTGTVSGAPIAFSGTLENDNRYPIVDGVLYVKIFKSRGDDSDNDGNGPDVVDQFIAKSDVAIPAQGSVPVSFEWRVPSYAATGEYSVATFFLTSRKFNLLGLTFTDDVVGNTIPFSVAGENEGGVSFEKTGVTINDEPYFFTAFPPRTDAVSPVVVEATINNTIGSPQSATLSWSIYQWDAQLRENVVQEETRQITVPAGTSNVSIVVTDSKYPVYLAVGTLKWMDTQSIIGARFVREGVDRTRINFPGVTAFPLMAGEPNTLFSCLHNSGTAAVVSGGSLDLTIADRDGNTIHEYRYDGDITGDMMGIASEFTPRRTYDYFTLSARLYQGGEFVDEANLVYDCAKIDPALCSAEAPPGAAGIFASLQALITIALSIIVLFAVLILYRRINRPTTTLPPM